MIVFSRHCLAQHARARWPTAEPALLLEGDWPHGESPAPRYSLDSSIDARHGDLDLAATELAEQLSDEPWAWLNALALRYYFVRLLRPIAFFDSLPTSQWGQQVQWHGDAARDGDYAQVLEQICRQRHVPCETVWHNGDAAVCTAAVRSGPLRRFAAWMNARCFASRRTKNGPRILLCGNPRILEGVCAALLARGCQVGWLYDRFAFHAWRRWSLRGVEQLTCDAAIRHHGPTPASALQSPSKLPRLDFNGIDLSRPVLDWLHRVWKQRGSAMAAQQEQVERHFCRWRPDAVVLDEDATPFKRAVVAAARSVGATSFVVQHGAPRVRFGFAPLAADFFLAWGRSSAKQLIGWGVPRHRIRLTGSPSITARRLTTAAVKNRPILHSPRILLFDTTVPSDSRPDAVQYHLTSRAYDNCLRMAFQAVARFPGAQLCCKLHPRCRDRHRLLRLAREFPRLDVRLIEHLPRAWQERFDAVLNCGSSAGIEAAYYGSPVIELLPEGSKDLTPAGDWGLFGSARTDDELYQLLNEALTASSRAFSWENVFAAAGEDAASAIVDAVLRTISAAVPDRHGIDNEERLEALTKA